MKLVIFKAGESIGKALDLALRVMPTTPRHTRLKKSVSELQFGREPTTEMSNMCEIVKLKKLKENHSFRAIPEALYQEDWTEVLPEKETKPQPLPNKCRIP